MSNDFLTNYQGSAGHGFSGVWVLVSLLLTSFYAMAIRNNNTQTKLILPFGVFIAIFFSRGHTSYLEKHALELMQRYMTRETEHFYRKGTLMVAYRQILMINAMTPIFSSLTILTYVAVYLHHLQMEFLSISKFDKQGYALRRNSF